MKALLIIAVLALLLWLYSQGSSAGSGSTTQGAQPISGPLSIAAIRNLWIQLGGDPSKAQTAAAVAFGESSGDPNAFNGADPNGGSFGLFQINGIHGSQATFDPVANVQAAIEISNNGQNWTPWGAYTNGSYAQYLGAPDDGS